MFDKDYIGPDSCNTQLNGYETAVFIKQLCIERISKMGLHTLKSGACKSCPFRYRGSNVDNNCCMFQNLPRDWSDEHMVNVYRS